MNENEVKHGYVYHIKDTYFDKANDDKLMRNYEGGAYRPAYYCIKDEKTRLLWVIPMSTRIEKYQPIIDKEIEKHRKCKRRLLKDLKK
jgi:hypothetical protein